MNRFFHFSYLIIIALAMIIPIAAHGQSKLATDSLRHLLDRLPEDNKKVDALNALSVEYLKSFDSSGYAYATEALVLSRKLKYKEGTKVSLTNVGLSEQLLGNYTEALTQYLASESISSNLIQRHRVNNLRLIGNVLIDLGKLDSAKYYFDKALVIANKNNYPAELAHIFKGLARMKMQEYDQKLAIEHLQKAIYYRNQASDTSKLDLYIYLIEMYTEFKDFKNASTNIQKFESVLKDSTHNTYFYVYLNTLKAEYALRMGDYPLAIHLAFDALERINVHNFYYPRIKIFSVLGEVYSDLAEYELSISYYLKALAAAEKSKLKPFESDIRLELAWIYLEQKHYHITLKELDITQSIALEIRDSKVESSCYNIRGLVYLEMKNFERAERELKKALELRQRIGYDFGVRSVLFNLSLLYSDMGRLNDAFALQLKAVEIDKKYNQPQSLSRGYNYITGVLLKMNRLDEAKDYLDLSLENAERAGSMSLLKDCYEAYARLYEAQGDFSKALKYHKLYAQYNDSIYSEKSINRIAEMQALYQVERKQSHIDLLNKQKELQSNQIELSSQKIKNQNLVIVAAAVVFIILIFFINLIFRINKDLRKSKSELAESNEILQAKQEEIQAQSEELSESNAALANLNEELQASQEKIKGQAEKLETINKEVNDINKNLEIRVGQSLSQLKQAYNELDTFFYRASHDFRRPITTFLGLAEVANITVKDKNALELFSKVKETATNLDRMILKLQSISDIGAVDLEMGEMKIKKLLEEFAAGVLDTNIHFEIDADRDCKVFTYPVMLKTVLRLIIENAIDFKGNRDPFIHCAAKCHDDGGVEITISDNGVGIGEDYLDRVFDMYFRANESSKGNGLGLYIVRRAMGRLNGHIIIKSELNLGTTVKVFIPSLS